VNDSTSSASGSQPNLPVWTVGSCLDWTQQYMEHHDDDKPRLSAQWLLSAATGLSRIELYMQYDKPMTDQEKTSLREFIQRRLNKEPLQYISGRTAFRYIELKIVPGVFIPRPETETLVDLVLKEQAQRVLEVGCGSGAISLALLHEQAELLVWATDIDSLAVSLTEENYTNLGLAEGSGAEGQKRLVVIQDDLASSLLQDPDMLASFDVLVSNPPYIPSPDLDSLPSEVKEFEPLAALDGGPDGLDFYRRLLDQAVQLLKPGGCLAVELHETRLGQAAELASAAGFSSVDIYPDLNQRERFLTATL